MLRANTASKTLIIQAWYERVSIPTRVRFLDLEISKLVFFMNLGETNWSSSVKKIILSIRHIPRTGIFKAIQTTLFSFLFGRLLTTVVLSEDLALLALP